MNMGFFAETFHKFLIDNHPDILSNIGDALDDYIQNKSDDAGNYYEKLVKSGTQPGFALDATIAMMKEGLLFSKYNEINEIVKEFYPELIDNLSHDEKVSFIVKIVNVCEDIFERYDTSDSFIDNDHLLAELIGCIELFLKR